ncbi:MAG: hypothetical protein V4515_12720 [Chloroflexota bacterium]
MADGGDAYDRGHVDGGIAERLAGHDRHFARINGSLEDVARALAALTLAVQRLGDQAIARDATVLTTAAALKDADDARRDKSEQSWSPWQKSIAVLVALASIIGVVLAVLTLIR